jgi:DNA polymerase III alpha subunit
MKNFPSPHVHLQSLDTASTPEAFAEREVELGSTALTCTDHGSMGACRETYSLAKEKKLIPILGLEGYVRDDDCPILKDMGIPKDEDGTFSKYNKYYHITMHALDQQAYEAMVKELSNADYRAEQHGSERKPLFTWQQLELLGGYNITMTSGCLIGMVQRHLLGNRPDIAMRYYDRLRSIPKAGNFYVELFPHKCDTYWVSGVFVELEGEAKPIKFWKEKKLRTTMFDSISAEDLAKIASRGKELGQLVAVMNNRKWEDREPKQIVSVKLIEDFLQNECRPWCPDGDVQLGANKFMMHLAKSRGDALLISDDAHFARPEDKIVQDSRLGSSGGSWKFANSYHRQTADEAWRYFNNTMGFTAAQFEALVESNLNWASRFKDFTLKDRKSLPASFYPKDTLGHLKVLIDKHGRMDWTNPVLVERLKKEVTLLHDNGTIDLLPYFFMAEEVVYQYHKQGLLTGPGRGSAAGMLTAYLLGITHVDPLKYQLSEDRFLTLDRIQEGGLPDIDLDFPDRELLTDPENGWLYKRFGKNVAAVSTNTMLRLKSSIKDVHRSVHGRVEPEIEALCKKLPNPPQGIDDADFIFGYTGDDGKEVKGLLDESDELKAYIAKYPTEWGIVRKMLGIARQKSRHACAYVICDEPIDNFIPLQTISGIRTTQYTAPWVEAAGGVKMDFLGLNSLKDLSAALKMIQARAAVEIPAELTIDRKRVPNFRLVPFKGQFYDIWDLPPDQTVYNEIAESNTESVFQLNTNSAKQWLRQFNYEKRPGVKAIDSLEAIAAFTALDRPGPLDAKVKNTATGKEHNMLIEYANRAKGLPAIGEIPALTKMFPETYGTVVFQEQLERVYRYVTDSDGIQSAKFRKNIAKKKMDKVLSAYPDFKQKGSAKLGAQATDEIWNQLVTFGQYGFNASHAICYSDIAYACAFLKRHFPLEWWCAVLSNADKKEISEKFYRHCKQWVDLPDVRYSGDVFEIQTDRIRAPLSFINGVGEGAHRELCAARPITDIVDLCTKIVKHKIAGTRPVCNKNGEQELDAKGKPRFRSGTSALNSGVISRLITAGVMDSLFDPTCTTVTTKIEAYRQAFVNATEAVTGKKTKPPKVKAEYLALTPLTRFQMQKDILPILNESLLPLLVQTQSGFDVDGEQVVYRPDEAETIKVIKSQIGLDRELEAVSVVTGKELKFYADDYPIEDGERIWVAVAAYIVNERRFVYGKEKPRTACELTFDVDGEQFTCVRWPDKETGQLKAPPEGMTGALAILYLTKWHSKKPFSIDAIVVVQQPLSDEKSESSQE